MSRSGGAAEWLCVGGCQYGADLPDLDETGPPSVLPPTKPPPGAVLALGRPEAKICPRSFRSSLVRAARAVSNSHVGTIASCVREI